MDDLLNTPQIEALATKIAERIVTPRWLKLKPAIQYSGYGRAKLIELSKANLIIGYQDPDSQRGDWIFDKKSIDEYRISHVVSTRHKAQSIINSLKAS